MGWVGGAVTTQLSELARARDLAGSRLKRPGWAGIAAAEGEFVVETGSWDKGGCEASLRAHSYTPALTITLGRYRAPRTRCPLSRDREEF